MNQSQSKIIDERLKDERKKKLILKKIVNYIPKVYCYYLGSKMYVFYYGNGYENSTFKEISQIFAQQQFTLHGQSRIIKKWEVNFQSVTFMNLSHQFIGQTQTETQIWKINNSYNLSFFSTIFTYEAEESSTGLMLTSNQERIIYIFKKEDNNVWKLQKELKPVYDFSLLYYRLNEQGNIFILSFSRLNNGSISQFALVVYLRVDEQWRKIEEILFPKYFIVCFLDKDKFALLQNGDNQIVLQTWQVIFETKIIKSLQREKIMIQDWITDLKFFQSKNFLMAMNSHSIYFISQCNQEYQVQKLIIIPNNNNKTRKIFHPQIKIENLRNQQVLILDLRRIMYVLKLYQD